MNGGAATNPPSFAAPPSEPKEVRFLEHLASLPNAAASPHISEDDLTKLATQVFEGCQRDLNSRADWEDVAERAMDAAKQKREGKNYPFPNAANVRYPLIAIAALQFNARAYPAICPGREVVKAKIGGGDPQGVKASRATRIASYMSHQITDEIVSWEAEMDVLLYQQPIVGCAFKKTFYDAERNHADSKIISAFDLIVNDGTRCLETCPRISHRFPLYPYEIEARQRAGIFLDVDLSADYAENGADEQAEIWFIEQHCYYDLDGDGLDEPWIVTVTRDNHTLVRIVAGFDPLQIVHDGRRIVRIPRDHYFSVFNFLPNPEGGFYGIGFGHLLDAFSEVINTSFNQMLDAGSLQNAGGGFVGSGLDLQSEQEEFRMEPGKYYTVTSEAGDIKSNLVTIDHPGPSPVLFQLLGMMMDSAKQMVSIQDILTGAASAQTMQPTTMMALIDQGLKVFTAIYKRIYNALTAEFRVLYKLNAKYLTDEVYSKYLGQPAKVADDFADDGCLVTPVADPNSVTMMMRMALAQFYLQLGEHPMFQGLLNPLEILQRVLEGAGADSPEKLIKQPAPPSPQDQIAQQTALANLENLKAQAFHNTALAEAEQARGEHFQAKTADLIMNQQPDFMKEPTGK